ncbi:hypothetical protein V3Q77_13145 [Flavobacterium davisii]|uniref:ABC transporter permease n=2 Tax=Flavobacterium davisii TaxID=2906077 RepID=A0ABW8PSC6_9FLAO
MIKLEIEYFKIQFKLFNRQLKDSGISLQLAYPLLIIGFWLGGHYLFKTSPYAHLICFFYSLSICIYLSDKERNSFLKTTFNKLEYRKIRILENIIFNLPIFILLILNHCYLEILILLLSCFLFVFISFKKCYNTTIPTPFSKNPFEFSIGFRKKIWTYPLFLFLAIMAMKVRNLNLGIVATIGPIVISYSYYLMMEPDYFIWIHQFSSKEFLKYKIYQAIKNSLLLSIILLLSISLYFYQSLDKILFAYGLAILFFCLIIIIKYASYPNKIGFPQIILITFCIYLPPLLLVFIPYFYKKAYQKINKFLYD